MVHLVCVCVTIVQKHHYQVVVVVEQQQQYQNEEIPEYKANSFWYVRCMFYYPNLLRFFSSILLLVFCFIEDHHH